MAEQLTTRSAWPDPPTYYKRYTDENLALKKKHTNKDTKEQHDDLGFMLESLEPPTPPTDGYNVFDQNWQVKDHLPTLKDLGVRQLFPDPPIDRISELKRLNRTLIVQFLELLEVLVERPEEFGKNIENISTIFINMHHILNAYRPHQARETLRLLMENQLARKKQQTEELKRKSKEALELLSGFATELKSTSLAQDQVISEQQPSETQDTEMKEAKDSQLNENTNMFIDMIDGIQ